VGFTKKPRQLTAKARVASAAKAHSGRSFDFVDDMFVNTPSARPAPCSVLAYFFAAESAKIVAEMISPGAHRST
jgi:hypothetical protein